MYVSKYVNINFLRKLTATFAVLIFMFNSEISYSMDYRFVEFYESNYPKRLLMSGNIVIGDYDKLIRLFKANPADSWFGFKQIEIDSAGGDVLEAMRIANFLKSVYPDILINKTCASSCLLFYLSGANRYVEQGGRIGIHRPTFPREFYEKNNTKNIEDKYEKMSSAFQSFVLQQGLPNSIYEKLIATANNDIYWLSKYDIDLIGISPRAIEEKTHALCWGLVKESRQTKTSDAKERARKCVVNITNDVRIQSFDSVFGKKDQLWNQFRRVIAE